MLSGCPVVSFGQGSVPELIELLQKIFDERTVNLAKRAEERAAEALSAEAWTAGRQVVEGVIVSIKSAPGFGRYSAGALKMLVKRDDGSRIYCSLPAAFAQPIEELKGKRIRFSVDAQPKAEEPTFAFGKRPTKAEVIA